MTLAVKQVLSTHSTIPFPQATLEVATITSIVVEVPALAATVIPEEVDSKPVNSAYQ